MDSQGIEVTRRRLPELVEAAYRGRTTIITRHGRPCAALVPIALAQTRPGPSAALLRLKGCAPGLWGKEPGRTVAKLRNEWSE